MAKILILENDNSLREMLTALLRDRGHFVFATGVEEEAELVGRRLRWDLIIANIVLPGQKSATEFAVALHQSRPDLRVIFISNAQVPRDQDLTNLAKLPRGSHSIIRTPIRLDELLDELNRLLNNRAA